MQFEYNSDLPGVDQATGRPVPSQARHPTDFPAAQPIPCARITTRVFHPKRNQIATVQNVLVRTVVRPSTNRSRQRASSDSDMSSSSSSLMSSSSGSDVPMVEDTITASAPGATSSGAIVIDDDDVVDEDDDDRAYWVQRTIREAIYGRVLFALVLRKRKHASNDNVEWEVTNQFCAVKEMSWQHIRKERDRLAEDPIKEVSCMQYLKQWHSWARRQGLTGSTVTPTSTDGVTASFSAILDTNIMMPLDLLSDDRYLYSVMPYCDGGELFERLDMNERFPEEEARYWMNQILNGLENLQKAGICHRDMSLENLLVHENGALIIDMGMCLRIPFVEDDVEELQQPDATVGLATAVGNMSMSNGGVNLAALRGGEQLQPQQQRRLEWPVGPKRRYKISPQGTCGKWIYMSPEIYKNREPFDGFAVDMWAAGVILFLMLTGFPPWERACQTDERFKYMTAGYLVQMLTEWEIGLSSDAMDLLQRMLFLDPKDRLSLNQVRAHPWMVNGRSVAPDGFV